MNIYSGAAGSAPAPAGPVTNNKNGGSGQSFTNNNNGGSGQSFTNNNNGSPGQTYTNNNSGGAGTPIVNNNSGGTISNSGGTVSNGGPPRWCLSPAYPTLPCGASEHGPAANRSWAPGKAVGSLRTTVSMVAESCGDSWATALEKVF